MIDPITAAKLAHAVRTRLARAAARLGRRLPGAAGRLERSGIVSFRPFPDSLVEVQGFRAPVRAQLVRDPYSRDRPARERSSGRTQRGDEYPRRAARPGRGGRGGR